MPTPDAQSPAALAEHFHVSRARVAETLKQIEAAGIELQRADGAIKLDEVEPDLGEDRPAAPVVRAATSIAGINPMQHDPRGNGFIAKRMARQAPRKECASLAFVTADLEALGVFPASEMQGRAS